MLLPLRLTCRVDDLRAIDLTLERRVHRIHVIITVVNIILNYEIIIVVIIRITCR